MRATDGVVVVLIMSLGALFVNRMDGILRGVSCPLSFVGTIGRICVAWLKAVILLRFSDILSLSILDDFCNLLEINTVTSSSSSSFANMEDGFVLSNILGSMAGIDFG